MLQGYSVHYTINGSDPTKTDPEVTLNVPFVHSMLYNNTANITIVIRARAFKNAEVGPVVEVPYVIVPIPPVAVCKPKCVHGSCDVSRLVPLCICDTEWKGIDCSTPDQGDLVLKIDNDTAVYAAVAVACAGLVAVVFIAKKKITRKEPTEDEFVLVNAESKNDSAKLSSVYARIKANPDFVFAIEYEKTIIGRYHREEHVDLGM